MNQLRAPPAVGQGIAPLGSDPTAQAIGHGIALGNLGEQGPGLAALALLQVSHRHHFARAAEVGIARHRQRLEAGNHFVRLAAVVSRGDFAHRCQVAQGRRDIVRSCHLRVKLGRFSRLVLLQRNPGAQQAGHGGRPVVAFVDQGIERGCAGIKIAGLDLVERTDELLGIGLKLPFAVVIPPQVTSKADQSRNDQADNRLAIATCEFGILVLAHRIVDLAEQDIVLGGFLLVGSRGLRRYEGHGGTFVKLSVRGRCLADGGANSTYNAVPAGACPLRREPAVKAAVRQAAVRPHRSRRNRAGDKRQSSPPRQSRPGPFRDWPGRWCGAGPHPQPAA